MITKVIITKMVVRVKMFIMVVIFIMVEDRQDRQNCYLNLIFQITCIGQLSQFLRCSDVMVTLP